MSAGFTAINPIIKQTFTLQLSFWLVEYMRTFILIPQSHSQQGQNTSILSFFQGKGELSVFTLKSFRLPRTSPVRLKMKQQRT